MEENKENGENLEKQATNENKTDYEIFVDWLNKYKENSEQIKKKSEYRKYEKIIFKHLKNALNKRKLPKKNELYNHLHNMFEIMLYTRWNIIIRHENSSLFYNLLCNVCGINVKKNKSTKPSIKSIKTEKILLNIQRRPDIYNNTKRKLIVSGGIGAVAIGSYLSSGFFASVLSALPIEPIMELTEKKGETDIGFSSMPRSLWIRLGELPNEYKSESKLIRRSNSTPPNKKYKNKNIPINQKDESI